SSLQNLTNHFTAADGNWPAFGVPDFRVRMMAEAVEECRGQILWLYFAVLGMSADTVRGAMHYAAADAPAGKRYRIDVPPMVAAARRVDFWCSPKLGNAGDNSAVEQSTEGKVFQQCGVGRIVARHQARLEIV